MPKTEQGKARSSQNATRHGLTSRKMFVLQNESPEAWQQMRQACIDEFEPTNEFEHQLIEEIAFAKWRLRRLWNVETALWDEEMDAQAEAFTKDYLHADESTRQAVAFKSLAESKSLPLLSRYETRLKRDYRSAIKTLEERRAKRTSEAEPASESKPQEVPKAAPGKPKIVPIATAQATMQTGMNEWCETNSTPLKIESHGNVAPKPPASAT